MSKPVISFIAGQTAPAGKRRDQAARVPGVADTVQPAVVSWATTVSPSAAATSGGLGGAATVHPVPGSQGSQNRNQAAGSAGAGAPPSRTSR